MSLTGLTPAQIAALTAEQIAALTSDDIASLTVPQLRHLTAMQFSEFSPEQIGYFSTLEIADLAPAQYASLAPAVIAEFSDAQLEALRLSEATLMTTAQAAALSPDQVAVLAVPVLKHLSVSALQALNGLTLAQARIFSPAALAELSATQFTDLVAANLSAFGAGRLVDVTSAQLATLTAQQANGLTAGKIEALSGAALGGLSSAALATLRPGLVQALSGAQLNEMGGAAISALDPAYLTTAQIGALNAAAVAGLTLPVFDALFANDLPLLSTSAIPGVTVAELSSLTSAELATFTAAQVQAMSAAQQKVVYASNPVMSDLLAHESNGALSYSGALAVLQDAASGGMSASKFAALTTIADSLASGAIPASAYVAQIFNDVVTGNAANAWWTGGGASPVALGDLSATSSQTQAIQLIGKWFLGSDLPSFSGSEFEAGGYQTYSLPLFSAQGPQYGDVNQGDVGDCFFLAGLAETAKQDPSLIENMIQANGDNTYSVEFQVDGQADYVTVNNELPNFHGQWTNGSNMQFANNATDLWVPLIEKAYAQLMEQPDAPSLNPSANSYSAIDGGDSNGLTAITGQSVTELDAYIGMSSSQAQTDFSQIASAFNAGNGVMVATGWNVAGYDWVPDHMFAVTAIDTLAGTVTLYNPWGVAAKSEGLDASFTATFAQLEQEGVTLEFAVGKPAAA